MMSEDENQHFILYLYMDCFHQADRCLYTSEVKMAEALTAEYQYLAVRAPSC